MFWHYNCLICSSCLFPLAGVELLLDSLGIAGNKSRIKENKMMIKMGGYPPELYLDNITLVNL